jgi:hypothetical protein
MKRTSYFLLFGLTILCIALVIVIALTYSYDTLTLIESGVGVLILLAVAGFFWTNRRRLEDSGNATLLDRATLVGIILGGLWLVEISINNLLAPPLPARDIIDNFFWALIAISILVFSIIRTYQIGRIAQGIKAGAWSGFTSGLVACCTGLVMIVFGMRFITRDPLNIAEWAARGAGSGAPGMTAYFAYETFAGAFLHLIVLGIVMGALLGLIGGAIGLIVLNNPFQSRNG